MDGRFHARKASEALASLYVWDTVVSILEGSASPGRIGVKAGRSVSRVIDVAKAECQRMLKVYDKHVAATATPAKGESQNG